MNGKYHWSFLLTRSACHSSLYSCYSHVHVFYRKQASLWAAGQVYQQSMSDSVGKPKLDGCLVTVVNSLTLDDNQNCDSVTVTIDDNDNMVCLLSINIVSS